MCWFVERDTTRPAREMRSGLRVRSRLTDETGTLLRVTPAGNPVWRPDGTDLEITNGAGEIEEVQ